MTEHIPVKNINKTKDVYAKKLLESIVAFDTEEAV